MITLTGCNGFYEGWLCGVFGLEIDTDDEDIRIGYSTALETSSEGRMVALGMELRLGRNIAVAFSEAGKGGDQ